MSTDRIRVVLIDTLNTHNPAAYDDYFEPAEARRLLDTLECHFTPVRGSWLNRAEVGFNWSSNSVLTGIPDAAALRQEIAAWIDALNAEETDIDWRFTADDTRIKLRRLYPTIDE